MSDNRKYYYLKLKENYFDEDAIVLLESMQDGIAIPHTSLVNYNLNWTTFQTASSGSIKNFITASFTMQAEEWDC